MLAESACEYGAAIHRFGCVIAHTFIVVLLPLRALGNRCATFLQETLSPAGSAVGAILAFDIPCAQWHKTHNSRETKNVGCLQSLRRAAPRSTLLPINY